MSNNFNPREADRPPRSEGYSEETQQIFNYVENRGDQRIGQYLINAARYTEKYATVVEKKAFANHNEAAEQVLWSLEAPELLNAIEKMEKKVEKQ